MIQWVCREWKSCRQGYRGVCAEFYEWLDEINTTLGYRHFEDTEKAMDIYDHLGGEARREIKYWSQAERQDPKGIIEILREIYGQPHSLTRLQKFCFFVLIDGSVKENPYVSTHMHLWLSLMISTIMMSDRPGVATLIYVINLQRMFVI